MPELSRYRLWRNTHLATMVGQPDGIGEVRNGAVVAHGDRIVWVGPEADLPGDLRRGAEEIDCGGRWITPGLIDCHTHLVFAGNRSMEFEMRLAGESYEAIARAGGGIVSSVRSLRTASEEQLLAETLPRLDALISEGVTTVEVKSGYGLDLASERRSLRVARRLAQERPVRIRATCLAAHAVPPEYSHDRTAYVDLIVEELLPALAAEGLVDAVDGFCETIAFTPAEIERVFDAARGLGLPVKLHADQRTNGGGAALAARYGALSADHIEHTDDEGVAALAAAGTVAVVLPGAFHVLRETKKPPIAALRRHRVPIAVSTDANPGTSPVLSLLLAANLAATLFGLTVPECLAGITRETARALGLQDDIGTIEPGKRADFAIWNIDRPAELVYWLGLNRLHSRVFGGV